MTLLLDCGQYGEYEAVPYGEADFWLLYPKGESDAVGSIHYDALQLPHYYGTSYVTHLTFSGTNRGDVAYQIVASEFND